MLVAQKKQKIEVKVERLAISQLPLNGEPVVQFINPVVNVVK